MAFFTALMAVATFIVIYQNDKDKKEAKRAYVIPYFTNIDEGNYIHLIIKNFGFTEASNVNMYQSNNNENSSLVSDVIIKRVLNIFSRIILKICLLIIL